MSPFTESIVEDAGLGWLESLGYTVAHGPEIAPGELLAERAQLRPSSPWGPAAPGARQSQTELSGRASKGGVAVLRDVSKITQGHE